MAETLNLDKALDEAQEENAEETPANEGEEETPADGGEKKPDETKDEFKDLEEGKDFYILNDGKRIKSQDLIDGFMRQEDYTQKTMELSESRTQLQLAQTNTAAPIVKEEKTKIDLTEQNKLIETALGEMDNDDPMGIVMRGLFNQNNQVIEFINNQTQINKQAVEQASTEDNIKNVQKLINDSLEKEAKNYNLPVIKGADGEETETRDLWNQLVLADLQATNEELTLAQYNHRVNQIGKSAYKRLRTIISAASASKPKEDTGDGKDGSQKKKEKKPDGSSEEAANTDENKNKGLSLKERIDNAFDARSS